MQFYDHQFRIVVDPYGRDAVAEAAAQDNGHAVMVEHAFVRLGEEFEFRGDDAANPGDDYLSAMVVSGENEVCAKGRVIVQVLRLMCQ